MDAESREDAPGPSNLRLVAFAVTVGGALLMGIGSLLTWVTVGIADAHGLQTVSPGTDLAAGLFTLVCAVVVLVLVLVSRTVRDATRRAMAIAVIVAAWLAALLAAWFIKAAPDYYSPIDDQKLIDTIASATGRTTDDVRTALADVIDKLGGYTHVGTGPWVVMVGSLLAIFGGVLLLRWAKATRTRTPEGAGDPTPSAVEPALD